MQIPKVQKIDRQQIYPCPCRRRAKLKPITLTDAFGCDRCSLIFVVEDGDYSLVQLGGIDPYRHVWYWMGTKWQANRHLAGKYALNSLSALLLLLVSLVLLLAAALVMIRNWSILFPLAIVAIFSIGWLMVLLGNRDS